MSQYPPQPTWNPPPFQPERPSKPARSAMLPIVIGVGALLLVIVVAVIIAKRPGSTATLHNESATDKKRDISDAFSGGSVSATDSAAIQASFDRLVAAISANDAGGVANLFDGARMIDEIEAQGLVGKMRASSKDGFARNGAAGLARSFLNNPAMKYTRIQVRKTKGGANATEAVAYVRCFGGIQDAGGKLRFWLKRKGDGVWRIYDLEDLDSSIRISDFVAMSIAAETSAGNPPPWLQQSKNFQTLLQACASSDIALADQTLAQMEGTTFPPELDALRLMMKGLVSMAKGESTAALKLYDQAEALHADMPALHYLRAITYNMAKQPEKAVASANKYIELLGDDSKAYAEIGEAYETLNRSEDAIAAYKKGLADDPKNAELLAALKKAQAKVPATGGASTKP